LLVTAEDRANLLQDITGAISRVKETGLLMVNVRATDGLVNGYIMIEVNDLDHLNQVLKGIRKIKNILSVERYDVHDFKF